MISDTIFGCSRGSFLKISEGNFVIQEIYSCPKTGGKGGVKQVMMSKQTHEFFQRQIFLWKKFFFTFRIRWNTTYQKFFSKKWKKIEHFYSFPRNRFKRAGAYGVHYTDYRSAFLRFSSDLQFLSSFRIVWSSRFRKWVACGPTCNRKGSIAINVFRPTPE